MDTIITATGLEQLRAAAQRACDHHRLTLRAMPLNDREAHLAWLGRVEVTRTEYLRILDRYTRAYRTVHGA